MLEQNVTSFNNIADLKMSRNGLETSAATQVPLSSRLYPAACQRDPVYALQSKGNFESRLSTCIHIFTRFLNKEGQFLASRRGTCRSLPRWM